MTTSSDAQRMLRRAEEFAQDAGWRLSPHVLAPLGEEKDAEDVAMTLKTHHLFPCLHDWERTLRVSVYRQKEALARMRRTSAQQIAPSMRTRVEQLTCQMDQFLRSMVSGAGNWLILEWLSPLDQEIPEAEYVAITWEDGE